MHTASSTELLLTDTVIQFAEIQAEESGNKAEKVDELDEAKDK